MKKVFAATVFCLCVLTIRGEVTGGIFPENGSPEIALPEAGDSGYVIRDAFGSPVCKGMLKKGVATPVGLPRGYYWLDAGGKSKSFCIMASPSSMRADTPFCIDVAVRGGLGDFNGNRNNGLAFYRNLLEYAGPKVVRERFYWFEIERKPGVLSFSPTDDLLNRLGGDDIRFSLVVSNPSRFLTQDGKIPTDPLAVYRFAKAVAKQYRGRAACWEFWNEQDLHNSFPAPPWKYTVLLKAASLGFKDGAPDCIVSAGSFCTYPLEKNMVSGQMFAGDMTEYCDLFNFHIYMPIHRYPEIIEGIRSFLKDVADSDMPVWITECGTHAEGNATEQGLSEGTLSLNRDQELLSAEFLPKSQIILQQLGVSRTFSFILRRHIEQGGLKEWGMLRKDLSVKPGFVAYAVLNREIGGAELCGEAALLPSGRSFVYRQADGSYSLVLWNQSALDTGNGVVSPSEFRRDYRSEAVLPNTHGIHAVNVFGTPVELIRERGQVRIPVTKYPVYVHGLSSPLSNLRPPSQPGRKVSGGSFDRSIVFDADIIGKERVKVTVYNLSAETKKGRVTHNLLQKDGIPDELTLAPFQSASFELNGVQPGKGVEIGGVFNGKKATRLVIPARYFQMESRAFEPAADPARWQKSSSGESRIVRDENVDALKIDASFDKIDKWVYPRFTLNKEEQSAFSKAVGLSFEIRTEQNRKEMSSPSLVWIAMTDRKKYRIDYTPSLGDWVENRIMFPQGKIQSFEIGMNPKKDSITYWVRNIRLLYEK